MRSLAAATNIDPASGDYPNGRVRDLNGGAGTILNEVLMGDIIQFFQKLVIDAGITENGNPDNVSNGYQLIEALIDKIRTAAVPASKVMSDSETYAVTGFVRRVYIEDLDENCIVQLPNPANYENEIIIVASLGSTNGSYIQYPASTNIQTISSSTIFTCLSNGSKWYIAGDDINNPD